MNIVDLAQSLFSGSYFRALGFLLLLPIGDGLGGVFTRGAVAAGLSLVLPVGTALSGPIDMFAEAVIGAVLAVPLMFLIHGASMCGEIFDVLRGQSMMSIYDPMFEGSGSILGLLTRQGIWTKLLAAGVVEEGIVAIGDSIKALPKASLIISDSTHLISGRLLSLFSGYFGWIFEAFGIIALGVLTIELGFMLLSRIVPQMSFSTELLMVKSWLGFYLILELQGSLVSTDYSFLITHGMQCLR